MNRVPTSRVRLTARITRVRKMAAKLKGRMNRVVTWIDEEDKQGSNLSVKAEGQDEQDDANLKGKGRYEREKKNGSLNMLSSSRLRPMGKEKSYCT